MTSGSIYAWAVFNSKAFAGLRWKIFKNRKLARDFRKKNGGVLFKISKAS
ncbi:hypothetical protein [Dyella sp.]|nr:hypothetical protein [Dyella sp.]MDR3445964.1 hypothetical protein [Dyella sp.]